MKFLKLLAKKFLPDAMKIYAIGYDARQRLKKRSTLHLDVHLVEHCNLNCKGCDNYSCIAQEKFHSAEALDRDFCRIAALFKGKIEAILLLGGEPLLHPDICKILESAGKHFAGENITLVTNGILLSKQVPAFWQACRQNGIKISVTKYPIRIDHAAIEQLARQYGVMFEYYGDSKSIAKNLWKVPLNLDGSENAADSFKYCSRSNKCIALYEGKLFTCTGIPYIEHFNKHFGTNLQVTQRDYIDIYQAKDADEVFEFLRHPMPFCRYCRTKNMQWGIPWSTTKKDIAEWT
jgi:MoaA/NifB/PqqE/SkfB family radical SAM enzyme